MNLRILLIESQAEATLFLQEVLAELDSSPCWTAWVHVETLHASTWADAAAILAAQPVDVALLNPDLDDCRGAETFRRSQAVAPHIPVILLVEPSSVGLAERMVREGAQDFLIQKEVDCVPLAHAIRNAIDRHRLLAAARATSMMDTLTGLMNQRTFTMFASRDFVLAQRAGGRITILVAELKLGALSEDLALADLALLDAADRLRKLASPEDLVAYLGGGRFALAAFETDGESAEETFLRFREWTAQYGIAMGAAVFDPDRPVSLDSLLAQAAIDLTPAVAAA